MSILSGASLVIAGGIGSFGNAILKRFMETDISQIRIFSRDEITRRNVTRYSSKASEYSEEGEVSYR